MKGLFTKQQTQSKSRPNGKVHTCAKCGLAINVKTPKMQPYGNFKKGILNVGEAPGADEDRIGRQWQGKVGQALQRTYKKLGVDLFEDCLNINAVNCFVDRRTKIYTTDGYKEIYDIQIGDLVLTHKGRFKKVISRTWDLPLEKRRNHEYLIDVYCISNQSKKKYTYSTGSEIKFTVTANHSFMKPNGNWITAKNLSINDAIIGLGNKCEICGDIFFKKPHNFDSGLDCCSTSCMNIYQYKKNIRDNKTIVQNAHNSIKERIKKGIFKLQNLTENERKRSRIATAKSRQSKNMISSNCSILIGFGEEETAKYLDSLGINYIHQYAIGIRNYDFYLPKYNLLIEIDGDHKYHMTASINSMKEKDLIAKNNGYELIRISSKNPIEQLKRILKNHNEQYYFTELKVSKVHKRYPKKQMYLYCIEVEDDHSFIARGIVHHNCRPTDSEGNNRSPTNNEIAACQRIVLQTIEKYKPKMIILLGAAAVNSVIGYRWKRDLGGISKWRGWTIPDRDFNCWICPTFHPSYVERSEQEVQTVWTQDLEKFFNMIDEPLLEYKEPEIMEIHTHYDNEISQFYSWIMEEKVKYITIDFETTGLKSHAAGQRIVCIAIASSENLCHVFMLPNRRIEIIDFLELFKNPAIGKIAHNIKFEESWSTIRLKQSIENWIWDTMLAAHVLDNRPGITGLKFQTYVNFGIIDYESEVAPYLHATTKGGNEINRIYELLKKPGGKEMLLNYCGMDAVFTYRLAMKQMKIMNNEKNL